MNSTRWRSLTEFIMDLSREGSVKAEETEKGWFISYIDRSPGAVMSDEQRKVERDRLELDDAERDRQRSLAQLRAAQSTGERSSHVRATELARDSGVQVEFSLLAEAEQPQTASGSLADEPKKRAMEFGADDDDDDEPPAAKAAALQPKKLSKLEEIALKVKERQEHNSKRAKTEAAAPPPPPPADAWLIKGLIVKGLWNMVVVVVVVLMFSFFLVMNKKLENGAYYKKKGEVFEVHEGGTVGDVELLDEPGTALRLGAAVLETVLPQPGGRVVVVQGPHRLQRGRLLRLNVERFSADVQLDDGGAATSFPYEAICKIKSVD